MDPDIIRITKRLASILKREQAGKPLSRDDQQFAERIKSASKPAPVGRPITEPSRLPTYDSIQTCAAATRIPANFLRHAKRDGCPAFKSNRVVLPMLLEWAFGPGEIEAGIDWGAELKKWLAKRAKIQHDKDAERVMPIEQARQDIQLGLAIMFGELDRYANELPPVCEGLPALDIQRRLRDGIEDLKGKLRDRFRAESARIKSERAAANG